MRRPRFRATRFDFAGRPGPQDSRYQVRVTTEDLRVLTTISDLTEPEVVLESAVLSSVPPGARVLWQVDATLPGGENVSSRRSSCGCNSPESDLTPIPTPSPTTRLPAHGWSLDYARME